MEKQEEKRKRQCKESLNREASNDRISNSPCGEKDGKTKRRANNGKRKEVTSAQGDVA